MESGCTCTAFGLTALCEPLGTDRNVLCGPTRLPNGSAALLWRIYLAEDTLLHGMQLPEQAAPELKRQALDGAEKWLDGQLTALRSLGGTLVPMKQELRRNMVTPTLREWYLLTPPARTLRQAFPTGMPDEAEAIRMVCTLCGLAQARRAAGLPAGCLDPDHVMVTEEGTLLLGPWMPGQEEQRSVGFWTPGDADWAESYAAGMLLYWLMNGGSGPFESMAFREQDAEQRRLSGELPPVPAVCSAPLGALLQDVCRCRAYGGWTQEKLCRALRELADPEQAEEQRRQAAAKEQERRRKAEEEQARRAKEQRRLEQAEAKREKAQAKDAGTDAKDRKILAGIIGGLIVVCGVVAAVVATGFDFRLNSSLNSGNYGLALDQIEERRDAGSNVDSYVDAYIDECLRTGSYVEAIRASGLYSSNLQPDAQRIDALVSATLQAGEPTRAQRFLRSFSQINDACAALAAQLQQQYSEELS